MNYMFIYDMSQNEIDELVNELRERKSSESSDSSDSGIGTENYTEQDTTPLMTMVQTSTDAIPWEVEDRGTSATAGTLNPT